MANWNRSKVRRLAKGFTGRSKNCYGLALRRVHKAMRYAYKDRRVRPRQVRREWIHTINQAAREHGIRYSLFANALNKNSNVQLDRKILADLAINEPFSFKAVLDEVSVQANLSEITKRRPLINAMHAVSYPEALAKGFVKEGKPTDADLAAILGASVEPKAHLYGLRFPERDSKKDADYMRLSF